MPCAKLSDLEPGETEDCRQERNRTGKGTLRLRWQNRSAETLKKFLPTFSTPKAPGECLPSCRPGRKGLPIYLECSKFIALGSLNVTRPGRGQVEGPSPTAPRRSRFRPEIPRRFFGRPRPAGSGDPETAHHRQRIIALLMIHTLKSRPCPSPANIILTLCK